MRGIEKDAIYRIWIRIMYDYEDTHSEWLERRELQTVILN